jgi:hypothetical protein
MGLLALAAALLCVLLDPVFAATGAGEPTCKSNGCGVHVLTYFPSVRVVPGGRGEAVRIALHAAGIKHEDKHMIYSEYTVNTRGGNGGVDRLVVVMGLPPAAHPTPCTVELCAMRLRSVQMGCAGS